MRLSPTAAFYLQASIVVFFLAGSSAPTPLYPVYQAAWGFTPITTTLVFGVYALAVLAALLTLGSLSDYLGRRPVLLAAALLQAIAMAVFAGARGVPMLVIGRVLQGLATGAAAGAVGAGLIDLDRTRGTIANAIGPLIGVATGGVLSGLMVQYLPAPTQLVYLVLGTVFLLQAVGVALMPESVTRRPGALASLKPHFLLPASVRAPLLLAAPAMVAAWALAGFYGSLGPSLLRGLVGAAHGGPNSLALGGLALFVLAGSGAVVVLILRDRPPRAVMALGTAALVTGVAITLVAIAQRSLVGFFAGTSIAGMGFGAGFQGAIRTVLPLARPGERSGVLSVMYLLGYLAMGLPAVLGGLRAVHGGGLLGTAREYGVIVMILAAIALAGTTARRPVAARA
jgi:MFS family permease